MSNKLLTNITGYDDRDRHRLISFKRRKVRWWSLESRFIYDVECSCGSKGWLNVVGLSDALRFQYEWMCYPVPYGKHWWNVREISPSVSREI